MFLQTIELTEQYCVIDLLAPSADFDLSILVNTCKVAWHNDNIMPTSHFPQSEQSLWWMGIQLITEKINLENGWQAPDIKVIRNDGSGSYLIGRNVRVWAPKTGTFFPDNCCKIVCLTYGEVEVTMTANI